MLIHKVLMTKMLASIKTLLSNVSTLQTKVSTLQTKVSTLESKTNFRIVQAKTQEFTVSAGSTKWQPIPMPSSGNPIAIVGYQLEGTYHSNLTIYNIPAPTSGSSFAFRNMGTATATATLTVRYLVVG